MKIGFSTGSLAYGDFKKGIELLQGRKAKAIELSALRERELHELIHSLNELELDQFEYISFHAPSKLINLSESEVVELLGEIFRRKWLIVVHPDVIHDYALWEEFGDMLCIENMDTRKPLGRTASELEKVFTKLPNATFCLDLAHVKQVDPTMLEATIMIREFKSRLRQLHVSDLNSMSKHEPLSLESLVAYKKISKIIPADTPVIIESPVSPGGIDNEIKLASLLFDDVRFEAYLASFSSDLAYFYHDL